MSERSPEGPKPGPGLHKVETQEDTIARFEAALTEPAAQPTKEPSFTFVDKRNAASQAWSKEKSESAQSELDMALAAVEDAAVEDPSDTSTKTPTEAEVPPVAESPVSPKAVEVAETAEAAPKRGEQTHHDYHVQRPADGSVYRTNKNFQRAPGGSEPVGIAKNGREEYDKQIGVNDPNAAQKHYDEAIKTHEAIEGREVIPANLERPDYETMDTDSLVFAYAKAEMIGDKHVTDDIRNVYVTAMEEAYTKPGSTISYEEHEEALARFDRLTDAAIEYEKAKDPEHSALVDAAVERANKEPSVGDKLKKFWKKGVESAKKLFRPEYWGERFTAATNKLHDASTWALNLGVNETDTDEEADKKRKRNRVLFVAGGAALTVAAVAAASYGIGFAVGNGGHHAAEAVNTGGGIGHGGSAGNTLSKHDQAIANALTPHRAAASETAAAAAATQAQEAAQHAAEAIPAGFNVSSGEGGLELFSSLNIDPSKWAANANDLVAKFPQDFYNMPGGGVGIAHQGLLSLEARDAIEALR